MQNKDKITLPRQFTEEVWERCGSRRDLKKYIGNPATSYSQLTSFTDYTDDFVLSYLWRLDRDDDKVFANFGNAVGTAFEKQGKGVDTDWLDEDTLDYLSKMYYIGEQYTFEKPIVIPIEVEGTIVILYGFIDVHEQLEDSVKIIDIKTGSLEKRESFYSGDGYWQTRLYAYAEDLIGNEVSFCGVLLLDRKGNSKKGEGKHPLRLTGGSKIIPTPYVKAEVENYIEEKIKPNIKEISDYYKKFQDLFGELTTK